jgi:adenylate kinase family enzyme
METKVINLVGAPGAGKSTIASQLFSRMKWEGYDVELVSEYAKELVWEERMETMKNEVYLFGKQHQRLFRLKNKVQYIITDRPLILSQFYNSKYGDSHRNLKT